MPRMNAAARRAQRRARDIWWTAKELMEKHVEKKGLPTTARDIKKLSNAAVDIATTMHDRLGPEED